MQVIVNAGSYSFDAFLVVPGHDTGWHCEEYANVGFETEDLVLVSQYNASTDDVARIVTEILAEEG